MVDAPMPRSGSVEAVRQHLLRESMFSGPADADGSLMVHAEELHRRLVRLKRAGINVQVRLSPGARALISTAERLQEVRG